MLNLKGYPERVKKKKAKKNHLFWLAVEELGLIQIGNKDVDFPLNIKKIFLITRVIQ